MEIFDPKTGVTTYRKSRIRIEEFGTARELTFTCFHRYAFLKADRTREWFIDAMEIVRKEFPIDLWAYVIMPEHVHLLIYPRRQIDVGFVVGRIKEKVSRKAISYLVESAPEWLPKITVKEGSKLRRRFWQPGGGYDRNVTDYSTLQSMIDYIHMNPVRRGLVTRPEAWQWSSANWYAGNLPVPIEMDATIPVAP